MKWPEDFRDNEGEIFIFDGGLTNHSKKGHLCKIDFEFSTDKNFVLVIFENGENEICHKSNLKEVF